MIEHPNAEDWRNRAEDWRNRAEAAEQRLAEHMATCDAFPLAVALAQKRIEEMNAKFEQINERLGTHEP